MIRLPTIFFFFFFNDTATTEIYTLSLHDALPILGQDQSTEKQLSLIAITDTDLNDDNSGSENTSILLQSTRDARSEEHTSELQSRSDIVCRLLLEKKKKNTIITLTRLLTVHDRTL